jgi:hypothetical protein
MMISNIFYKIKKQGWMLYYLAIINIQVPRFPSSKESLGIRLDAICVRNRNPAKLEPASIRQSPAALSVFHGSTPFSSKLALA